MSGKEGQNYGDVSVVVVVVEPPSEGQFAFGDFVEGELSVLGCSAGFSFDGSIFGGAKVFLGHDGWWIMRLWW